MGWRYVFIAFLAAGCQNQATDYLLGASYITAPLKISPEDVTISVSKTVKFTATGGTPPYTFSLFSGNGQLSGSIYTAPSAIGSAVVSVKDSTGTRIAALITIIIDSNCPTNYLLVPYDTSVGTTENFCVSKYEMKCSNDPTGAACSGSPVSMAANLPWINVTPVNAKSLCAGLGTQYHLITNAEWMTLARNIEVTGSNWSGGVFKSGSLNRGHSDNAPAAFLAASTDDDACSGTGDVCSNTVWNIQRRTHVISNGNVFWDLAGNAKDYIDWTVVTGRAGTAGYAEINTTTPTVAMPANSFKSGDITLTAAGHGIGRYDADNDGTNGYAARGGHKANTSDGGIYALDMGNSSGTVNTNNGFRCAYK